MALEELVIGALFIVVGLLFGSGKIHTHFFFWTRMPEQEKEKVRIRPLCQKIGAFLALFGLLFLVRGFWNTMPPILFAVVVCIWLAFAIGDAVFILKSSYYINRKK